jgi:hypothetical protein
LNNKFRRIESAKTIDTHGIEYGLFDIISEFYYNTYIYALSKQDLFYSLAKKMSIYFNANSGLPYNIFFIAVPEIYDPGYDPSRHTIRMPFEYIISEFKRDPSSVLDILSHEITHAYDLYYQYDQEKHNEAKKQKFMKEHKKKINRLDSLRIMGQGHKLRQLYLSDERELRAYVNSLYHSVMSDKGGSGQTDYVSTILDKIYNNNIYKEIMKYTEKAPVKRKRFLTMLYNRFFNT